MKYRLLIPDIDGGKFYTEQTLYRLMEHYGHQAVTDSRDADMILVSICDVTEIGFLRKVRADNPEKKIVVGGHTAVFFKLMALFADYVNVGQAFDFFKCQTEDEIKKLPSVYYPDKGEIIIPSTTIDWSLAPIVQVSPKTWYYWAGVGCHNRCRFCLTSWTNMPQSNNEFRIRQAYKTIKEGKRSNLKLIENEGSAQGSGSEEYVVEKVKDMTVKGFLVTPKAKTKIIRMGLEFCLEENRKKMGKSFTNDEFIRCLIKAKKESKVVQFFCIGGIETWDEWFDFFRLIPEDQDRQPKIIFKFTNIDYNMFTPLYKERHNLDPSKYLTMNFRDQLWRMFAGHVRRVKTMPIGRPALAMWRTGTCASATMEQFNKMWGMRNEMDTEIGYRTLMESKVLENDYSDEIRYWHQKESVKNEARLG